MALVTIAPRCGLGVRPFAFPHAKDAKDAERTSREMFEGRFEPEQFRELCARCSRRHETPAS